MKQPKFRRVTRPVWEKRYIRQEPKWITVLHSTIVIAAMLLVIAITFLPVLPKG